MVRNYAAQIWFLPRKRMAIWVITTTTSSNKMKMGWKQQQHKTITLCAERFHNRIVYICSNWSVVCNKKKKVHTYTNTHTHLPFTSFDEISWWFCFFDMNQSNVAKNLSSTINWNHCSVMLNKNVLKMRLKSCVASSKPPASSP